MRARGASLSRLLVGLTLAVSVLPLGAHGVDAAPRVTPAQVRPSLSQDTGKRHATPQRGPQLLQRVPVNAFPLMHGFGDRRFGVVQALDAPQAADALHVGWERVQLAWNLLQSAGPQTWNVNTIAHDSPINNEIAHGRQIVGGIVGIPAWATVNPRDGMRAVPKGLYLPWNNPRNYWGQFIYRLVRHYAGRIDTFIIGNEISLATKDGHLANFAGTVQQYAQMLRIAYLAGHAANPHVEFHIFGDSVYGDYGHWFSRTMDVLASFPYAQANNLFFDAAEMHLYSTVLRWDWIMGLWQAAMKAHHVDKPVWLTETNTQPRNDPATPATPADYNAPLPVQSDFIVDAFAAALGLGFARVEVYKMRDGAPGAGDFPLGLVRYNGSPRPEYTAFKTANTWFAGVTAARYYPGSEPVSNDHPLFRVTMERPGQEIQVLWNQGGTPITARVPALAHTATLVQPDGSTSTLAATGGVFVLHLSASADKSLVIPGHYVIGGTPAIVVQDLPPGQHVPGLHTLFSERDRTAGAGTTLGPAPSSAIAPDGSGLRAIADTAHDRVLIEDAQGRVTATIGHTGGAPGQFRGPAGVAIGSDGTLYVADQGNSRIQEFTLSGQLLGGFGSSDAGPASLEAPSALAVAPDGTIYVVDTAQDAVLHFSRMGQFIGRWGTPGYGIGQFDGPGGITVDAQGNVYVADTLNNRVETFDGSGHPLLQIGTGSAGTGTNLHWPTDVAILPGGRLAIADADNNRVVTVDHPQTYLDGVTIPTIAMPGGLVVASDGSYYVSDTANNRVVHLDAAGHVLAAYGTAGYGLQQFHGPMGLSFGPDGNLYVANSGNNRITVLTPALQFVRSIGDQGNTPGKFLGPHMVSVASDGTIWVADTFNSRVQHLSATGAVLGMITHINGAWSVAADNHGGVYYSARWGQRIYHWHPDGHQEVWGTLGTGAGEFEHPGALAATADGNTVYAVDEDNKRVQFVAGGHVAGQRGSDSPGDAGLGDPVAVAVAPDGSIAVLDATRHRIVRYAGASAGRFTVTHMPGIPLGVMSDGQGAVATLCGVWSGLCTQQDMANRQ